MNDVGWFTFCGWVLSALLLAMFWQRRQPIRLIQELKRELALYQSTVMRMRRELVEQRRLAAVGAEHARVLQALERSESLDVMTLRARIAELEKQMRPSDRPAETLLGVGRRS
jgi:hypothetical protein